jgi:hypothetical protein
MIIQQQAHVRPHTTCCTAAVHSWVIGCAGGTPLKSCMGAPGTMSFLQHDSSRCSVTGVAPTRVIAPCHSNEGQRSPKLQCSTTSEDVQGMWCGSLLSLALLKRSSANLRQDTRRAANHTPSGTAGAGCREANSRGTVSPVARPLPPITSPHVVGIIQRSEKAAEPLLHQVCTTCARSEWPCALLARL